MTDRNQKLLGCASFNLRKASRVVAQLYDQHLMPAGLKTTQFTLLASLVHMGPASIGDLAAGLGMDRTTLTRNLRLLTQQGLIDIRSGQDARTRSIVLTKKGRGALDRAIPLWQQAQNRFVELFGGGRWQQLHQELIEVTRGVRADK